MCQSSQQIYPPIAWEENRPELSLVESWLDQALNLSRGNSRIRSHLSEVRFALGDRDGAASISPAVPLQFPSFAPYINAFRQLTPSDYRGYLLAARQYANAGNWDKSILAYRLAVTTGASYLLPSDRDNYWLALAEAHLLLSQSNGNSAYELYFAGKYYTLANRLDSASEVFLRAISTTDVAQLPNDEKAQTYLYLGRIKEAQGDIIDARQSYEKSVTFAPALNEPQIRLLRLTTRQIDNAFTNQLRNILLSHGPTYRLGRYGTGYGIASPAILTNGWTLVGYDLDTETLESSGWIEVWLWWRAPKGYTPSGNDWIRVGEYWLQVQTVLNLAPNAGFEWGTWSGNMPFGYLGEIYGALPGSVSLATVERQDGSTTVLRFNNDHSRHVGIQGPQMIVDPDGWYLMAGLKRDSGNANIGRSCSWHGGGGPYYIGYEQPGQPQEAWIQFAELSHPMPDEQARDCAILLLNYDTDRTAEWDDLVFAKIEVPPTR